MDGLGGGLYKGRLDSLVQGGFSRTELISELGRMWKDAGLVESKRSYSLCQAGYRRTDDIVKAYDPRFDLLLLEGEENNMQN